MKSILSIASAILFLACLTSCMTMYNNPDYEPKILDIDENSTVVCFGDSLTNGHGADRDTESWPAVLQEKIKIPVINSGKDDDTTYDGVQRFQTDVLDHNPAILIIDFGGNDIYYTSKRQSFAEIENTFRTMLNQIDFKFDMTHCNAKGYRIMAKNIFTMLEPCLRENDLLRY